MKKFLFLFSLAILATLSTMRAEIEVVNMTDDYMVTVDIAPGVSAKQKLKKGDSFGVVKVEGDFLTLWVAKKHLVVPASVTDFAQQKKELEDQEAARKLRVDKEKAEAAEKDEQQKKENRYDRAKSLVERAAACEDLTVGTDVKIMEPLVGLANEVVKAREANDADREQKANDTLLDSLKQVVALPVIGSKYNEVMKEYLATPITFSLFSDASKFYVSVGDGSWCTVAPIELANLQPIVEWLAKCKKWSFDCWKSKMVAEKESPKWGGVSFVFHSAKEGKRTFVTLVVTGESASDRLFPHQEVQMTMLNVSRLVDKIVHADQIVKDRENKKTNADKLN